LEKEYCFPDAHAGEGQVQMLAMQQSLIEMLYRHLPGIIIICQFPDLS
jgi:hypothetical protein